MEKRVAKVIYLIQEASRKNIHGLLGGHDHWCTVINDVMPLSLVVRLRSSSISY